MDYVLKYFFNKIFIQIFPGFLAKQSIMPAAQGNFTNYPKLLFYNFFDPGRSVALHSERNYSNSF